MGEGLGPMEPYRANEMRTGDEEHGNECWVSFRNRQESFKDFVLHSKAAFSPGFLWDIFNRYSMEKECLFLENDCNYIY